MFLVMQFGYCFSVNSACSLNIQKAFPTYLAKRIVVFLQEFVFLLMMVKQLRHNQNLNGLDL